MKMNTNGTQQIFNYCIFSANTALRLQLRHIGTFSHIRFARLTLSLEANPVQIGGWRAQFGGQISLFFKTLLDSFIYKLYKI